MLELILPLCLSLPEMQTQREFSGSTLDLLEQWVRGTDVQTLSNEFAQSQEKPEELWRYIDAVFRYLLPWSISAYFRIAEDVLTVERSSFSDYARFLPSMVKFGVPSPVACWAMSVGISSRGTAREFATAFLRQPEPHTYEAFLKWLGRLSVDRLRYEFRLSSPILEEVNRAVASASVNSTLRGFTNLKEFLPRLTRVRGIQFANRKYTAAQAHARQPVSLERDYDDTIDRNAIVVKLDGEVIGYLARDISQVLAPEIDAGATLRASIVEVLQQRLPIVRIRIYQMDETVGN
jgi:hypothetical protein